MSSDVFFLGAGFSKAINNKYPTLKDLSKEIRDNYGAEKVSVTMHLHNEVPDCYKKDIELLLTFLYSNLPYKTDVQISTNEALYKDITNKIAKYFNKKSQETNLQECLNKTSSLIEYIIKSRCTCVTLNYDTLLEQLLNAYTLQGNKTIDFDSLYNAPLSLLTASGRIKIHYLGNPDSMNRNELPDIIKLHGSLNWGVVSNNSDTVYYVAEDDEEYKKSHLQTYIIPPVLDKTNSYSNHVIKAIWKRAFEKLSNADNIYIYGFSFPPTDLSVRFLLQSALSNNHKNPTIFVINTSDALKKESEYYLEDRFKEIFEGYNLNFDYCCDNSLEKFVQEVIEPKLEVANAN